MKSKLQQLAKATNRTDAGSRFGVMAAITMVTLQTVLNKVMGYISGQMDQSTAESGNKTK